jgi:hypothetical protein
MKELRVGMPLTLRTLHRRTGKPGARDGYVVSIRKLTPKFIYVGSDRYHRDTLRQYQTKDDDWRSDWIIWLEPR